MEHSELLKHHLERLGWSQRELARRLDVNSGQVAMASAGRPLAKDTAEAWAAAMRLDGDDLEAWIAACDKARARNTKAAQPYIEELERRVLEVEGLLLCVVD